MTEHVGRLANALPDDYCVVFGIGLGRGVVTLGASPVTGPGTSVGVRKM
jgi:hypothetical protein